MTITPLGARRPALKAICTTLLEVALALRHLHARNLAHCGAYLEMGGRAGRPLRSQELPAAPPCARRCCWPLEAHAPEGPCTIPTLCGRMRATLLGALTSTCT